jgi:hypothetical protein
MTTKPETRKAPAAEPDPIFALIAEHKALEKEWLRLVNELDEAKHEAEKTHGEQPSSFACPIAWRNYTADCANAIDNLREKFLHEPNADPVQIEREQQDTKARCASIERAGVEWDRRAGIAPLRAQYEAARRAPAANLWKETRAGACPPSRRPSTHLLEWRPQGEFHVPSMEWVETERQKRHLGR